MDKSKITIFNQNFLIALVSVTRWRNRSCVSYEVRRSNLTWLHRIPKKFGEFSRRHRPNVWPSFSRFEGTSVGTIV